MATHAEIEAVEKPLIDAWNAIRHHQPYDPDVATQAARDALTLLHDEVKAHKYRLHENYNHWGTLGVNASVVSKHTVFPDLRRTTKQLAKALGVHEA